MLKMRYDLFALNKLYDSIDTLKSNENLLHVILIPIGLTCFEGMDI